MPGVIKRQATSRALVLDPGARLRQLSEHGSTVEIDKTIPIKRYFRSGSEMERQARVYYTEGQWDRAFMLYNKFATLFIEKLPKHPEYGKAPASDKSRIKKLLKEALPRAMELKEKLKEKYKKEKLDLEKAIQSEEAEKAKRLEEQSPKVEKKEEKSHDQSEEIAAFLGGQGGVTTAVVVIDESSKVTDEAMETGKSSPPPPPYEEVQGKGEQETLEKDSTLVHQSRSIEEEAAHTDLTMPQEQMEITPPVDQSELTATDPTLAHVLPSSDVSAVIDHTSTAPPPSAPPSTLDPPPSAPPPSDTFPSTTTPAFVAQQQTLPLSSAPQQQQLPPPMVQGMVGGAVSSAGGYQPAPPPPSQLAPPASQAATLQQRTYQNSIFQSPFAQSPAQTPPSPQSRPLTTPPFGGPHPQQYAPPYGAPYNYQYGQYAQPPPGGVPGTWSAGPSINPAYQVSAVGVAEGVTTEEEREEKTGPPTVDRSTKPDSLKALNTGLSSIEGCRPLFIPLDTASRFEEVASSNTCKNIETCGILAGKLSQDKLRITHIIVPKQKGKPDSCETLNEEELFDVQDQYDLITLGWIHTHPSQTAFLSSVDLHCHCSYQVMMDEAVAIVVAPKYSQVGYYMLTDPHGLNYITHCEEEGFHVHPKEPPLYEECKHIHHDTNSFIQIVDLR